MLSSWFFLLLQHCYFLILFYFLTFCACGVSLFSMNNGIESIAIVFCYKKNCSAVFYRFAIIL